MKYSYRITKYTQTDNLGNLCSSSNEWISFYDIGNSVTEVEYKKVEEKYIDYILNACNCLGVKSLRIQGLELNIDKYHYVEDSIIQIGELKAVIQSILREYIWCKLISDKCEFHFGYDFYIYFLFNACPKKRIDKIKTELTVQRYNSPY